MYPLGATTFSNQFAEVVGKKIIFPSGKPKKNWRWWETEKKIPSGKKKTLHVGCLVKSIIAFTGSILP